MGDKFDIKTRYVLALDPSGAFEEGKGTTGWVLMDCKSRTVLELGEISAKQYENIHEYWNAHKELIRTYLKKYNVHLGCTMEGYRLYESRAAAQINSSFETSQMIGVLRQYLYENGIDYKMHMAVVVKARCTDMILTTKGVMPEADFKRLSGHIQDAIRHGYYYSMFECFY